MMAGLFSVSSYANVKVPELFILKTRKVLILKLIMMNLLHLLIQSWIDTGDASVAPDSVNVPLLLLRLYFV